LLYSPTKLGFLDVLSCDCYLTNKIKILVFDVT
jgi:hypothetical protein